jgi:hypothetical protein
MESGAPLFGGFLHWATESGKSFSKSEYGVHFFHLLLISVRQLCTLLFYGPWQHFDGPPSSRVSFWHFAPFARSASRGCLTRSLAQQTNNQTQIYRFEMTSGEGFLEIWAVSQKHSRDFMLSLKSSRRRNRLMTIGTLAKIASHTRLGSPDQDHVFEAFEIFSSSDEIKYHNLQK